MRYICLSISFLFFLSSCDKDDQSEFLDGFDRNGMLTNWVDNIIIPSFNHLNNSLDNLNQAVDSFIENPNVNSHQELSNSWFEAYKYWQHVQMFNINLAENIEYQDKINSYPTDTDLINENISNNVTDLNIDGNESLAGFPAMDYMLHGLGSDVNYIIDQYVSSNLAENNKNYLKSLIESMMIITSEVTEDWNNSRNSFINSTDNTATSSLNKIINDYIYYFEKYLRDGKFGIPAGIRSGGFIRPETVEGLYKRDVSKDLAIEALLACENFFTGNSINNLSNGVSLEDYLNYLPTSSENNLSQEILSQFDKIETTINIINLNFYDQVNEDKFLMLNVWSAMQQMVALLKTDMLGTLSIATDYTDTDGD